MLGRVGFLALGILLVSISTLRFFAGIPTTRWGQPVSPLFDIAIFPFGIVLIFLSIFKPDIFKKNSFICPNCENVYEQYQNKEPFCTKCKSQTEKLEGFYDKKPVHNYKETT